MTLLTPRDIERSAREPAAKPVRRSGRWQTIAIAVVLVVAVALGAWWVAWVL